MKAAVLKGPKDLYIEDVQKPVPGAKQVKCSRFVDEIINNLNLLFK